MGKSNRPSNASTGIIRTGVGIFAVACVFSSACPANAKDQFDIVVKEADTATNTVWRVQSPNVKQKLTDYHTITFAPGDTVSIFAGGCVQTGGHGKTWKRYVDPRGDKSDHLYHGLISIPGVTNGLERIQQFGLNTVYQVPSTQSAVPSGSLYLKLGYEDDGYGDNGYWGHDNGTGDQCKNVGPAFVIISIGHSGAAPVTASSFDGIKPDRFRCKAGWAFINPKTPSLSWATFKDAFNLGPADYLDVATYIIFAATRNNLAAGGNCMGMALLADVGEDQFVVDDLHESLFDNYKNFAVPSPRVMRDINVAHWEQLSAAFLHSYLSNVIKSPAENATLVEYDLTKPDYNYGMISIAHGSDGHVVVPTGVRHVGTTTLIDVYDPNRPCGQIPGEANYPPIIINGSRWSFRMNGGDVWSGSTANDGLAYVPYVGSSGWRDFAGNFTGIFEVIFGSNVEVEQVSDARGRNLFVSGSEAIDTSELGLGGRIVRLPTFHQTSSNRPRKPGPRYTMVNPNELSASNLAEGAKLESEYGADYANSRSIYVTADTSLAGLTFRIRAIDSKKPVRALLHQGNQFFELKIAGAKGAKARFVVSVPRPSALASEGVGLRGAASSAPFSATLAYGMNDRGKIHVQRTAPSKFPDGIRIRAPQGNMTFSAVTALLPISMTDELTDESTERVTRIRTLAIVRDMAPGTPH